MLSSYMVEAEKPNQATEQEATVKETAKYSIKDAEPVDDNMILKVTNFDQPSTRYYYTPYPVDTNVLIYGEVIAVDKNNRYHLTNGDCVLYNGSVVYQTIEDGDKYVVVPVEGVMLIWRCRAKQKRTN
jgi:co-chaperonin GroES (HSP10)